LVNSHQPRWCWLPTFEEDPWVSSLCQCQVLSCMKHFLLQKFSDLWQNNFFTIIITISGVWILVMVINQGDVDFLHLMKVYWYLHYANYKSSHVWNIVYIQNLIELWQNIWFTIVITRNGPWKLVMVINQGDVDFLHLMKVHWCLYCTTVKSSHVWNII